MSEEKMFTLAEAHKSFAQGLNGQVWNLLQKPARSKAEDEVMLYSAYSSCYHWLKAGNGLHHQRAEWLISHVYAELGIGSEALRHANRCFDLTNEFSSLMQDFDWAYAYEAMARAYALLESKEEFLKYFHLAEQFGQAISNKEDKDIFTGDLNSGKWYGLR
ncbi:MAG: hypothetical protein HUU50_23275 [Candidatus Brocadiae bacterium]|nr:hypothetical protein [Candidatus Brocadiia bacterium]